MKTRSKNPDLIKGEIVSLRPLTPDDKETFYLWATASDATPFWYGELYNDPIPDREKIFEDWKDFYFDGSQPLKGRAYAIIVNESNKEIGEINYQKDEEQVDKNAYEFDILIASEADQNEGYGSHAIKLLTAYLTEHLNLSNFSIYAHTLNKRAINAYKKAGFQFEKEFIDHKQVIWVKLTLRK